MPEEQAIEFYASLPPTSTALSTKGDGSGKIVLEFSASELHKVIPLTVLGETLLKVRVTAE